MDRIKFNFLLFVAGLFCGAVAGADGKRCHKRDVSAASLVGHYCQNSCVTSQDCRSSARRCTCDGLCGKSCVQKNLKCQTPGQIANGAIKLEDGGNFNSLTSYFCNDGYVLEGRKSRVCRGNGKWDQEEPRCVRDATDNQSVPKTPSTIGRRLNSSEGAISPSSSEKNVVTEKATDTKPTEGDKKAGDSFIGVGLWDNFKSVSTEKPIENDGSEEKPDVDGESKINDEDVDTTSTYSKRNNVKECGQPPKVGNTLSNGRQKNYKVGSIFTYKCNYGFYISSISEQQVSRILSSTVCAADAERNATYWTKVDFACKAKSCSDPGDVVNGAREGYLFTVGSRVRYSCDDGHSLIGRSFIFCTPSGKWNRRKPTCQPIKCPKLESPVNGRVSYTSTEYSSTASYDCQGTNVLLGDKIRRCLANGTWSGSTPNCDVVLCYPPEFLPNGRIIVGKGPIVNGYLILFECNEGSTLDGSSTAQCLQDGSWSYDVPYCKATCAVADVANGKMEAEEDQLVFDGKRVKHRGKLTLKCNDGFEVSSTQSSEQELQCKDGNWYPAAECIPASCISDDAYNQRPKNARFTGVPSSYTAGQGELIKIECYSGYESNNNNNLECKFGQWEWSDGKPVECQPKSCTVTSYDIGGNLYEDIEDGTVLPHGPINLECQIGDKFKLSVKDNQKIMCNLGKIEPSPLPNCLQKSCPALTIANGGYTGSNEHGSKIDVKCDRGYHVADDSPTSLQCDYGNWQPDATPVCSEGCKNGECDETSTPKAPSTPCSYDPFRHTFVETDIGGGNQLNRVIKVASGAVVKSRCKNRTKFKQESGTNKATCKDGQWRPDEPLTCRRVRDGDIITPFQVWKLYDTSFWGKRTYYGGFIYAPDGTIILKKKSKVELYCRRESIRSIYMSWETTADDALRYSYEKPNMVYRIKSTDSDHSGVYTCTADRQTDSIKLKVVREFKCPSKVPWQGDGLIAEISGRSEGSTVKFTCEQGFELEGSESARCNDDYIWALYNPPMCKRKTCYLMDLLTKLKELGLAPSTATKWFFEPGEDINIQKCLKPGLTLNGYAYVKCDDSAKWSQVKASCIPGCQKPEIDASSKVKTDSTNSVFRIGERLTFYCSPSYIIKESYEVILCTPNGWNKVVPSCKPDEKSPLTE